MRSIPRANVSGMLPEPQRACPRHLALRLPCFSSHVVRPSALGSHPRLPSRVWEAYIITTHSSVDPFPTFCTPALLIKLSNLTYSSFYSRVSIFLLTLSIFLKFNSITMALAMNVRTQVVAAPVVASVPSLRQASSGTSVRFSNGAVAFKRASLMVVRAESKVEPGPGGRGNTSSAPTTPAGMSGSEAPLGVVTKSAPLEQGSEVPVAERVAYICQDCGYVYDDQKPFEDVGEDYNCPKCSAPKARFMLANASVGEVLDTTKEDPQN